MTRWASAPEDRQQAVLFAERLDEAVPAGHVVRLLDELLAAPQIDWSTWEADYHRTLGHPHGELNAIAVYMIAAWRVMALCRLGRECPDLVCEVPQRHDPPDRPARRLRSEKVDRTRYANVVDRITTNARLRPLLRRLRTQLAPARKNLCGTMRARPAANGSSQANSLPLAPKKGASGARLMLR